MPAEVAGRGVGGGDGTFGVQPLPALPHVVSRVSLISTFVKKFIESGLIWFSGTPRVEW